jgi:hypothetical protein
MGSGGIYEWDINQTGWAYRERCPDFDMALLRPETLVAPWSQPGADIKADVQAMMAHWERDALDIGVEVEWPHDLVTRLITLFAPPNACRRHWRRYLGDL